MSRAEFSVADGKLFVADTNNQAIRVVEFENKGNIDIKDRRFNTAEVQKENETANISPNSQEINLNEQKVSANAEKVRLFSKSNCPKVFT